MTDATTAIYNIAPIAFKNGFLVTLLAKWDDFSRQLPSIVDYPEVIMQQTQKLLSV